METYQSPSFFRSVDGLLQTYANFKLQNTIAENEGELAAANAAARTNAEWAERVYQSQLSQEAAANQIKAGAVKWGSYALIALLGLYVAKRAGVI